MKRSEINTILREGDAFIRDHGFKLPRFASFAPDEMRALADTAIYHNRLGWDVTDYGEERFSEYGLFLFTIRNGNIEDLAKRSGMLYAEKIMISRDSQICPMHSHYSKVEDIINRAGGDLVLELYGSHDDGCIDRERGVDVAVDGMVRSIPAGDKLRLLPGESVTLVPGVWHAFWAEHGDCMIGEVSTVNDDLNDNWFEEEIGRFSEIEEDEEPWRLLVSDY